MRTGLSFLPAFLCQLPATLCEWARPGQPGNETERLSDDQRPVDISDDEFLHARALSLVDETAGSERRRERSGVERCAQSGCAARLRLCVAVRGGAGVRCPARPESLAGNVDRGGCIPAGGAARPAHALYLSAARCGPMYQPGVGICVCARLSRWRHLRAHEQCFQILDSSLVLFRRRRRAGCATPVEAPWWLRARCLAGGARAAGNQQLAVSLARHAGAHLRSPALGARPTARVQRRLYPHAGRSGVHTCLVSRRRGSHCLDEPIYCWITCGTGSYRTLFFLMVCACLRLHGTARCAGLARSRRRTAL